MKNSPFHLYTHTHTHTHTKEKKKTQLLFGQRNANDFLLRWIAQNSKNHGGSRYVSLATE